MPSRPHQASRLALAAFAAPLLASLTACGNLSPARVGGVPAHFASHQLCSAVFVGGLDPDAFYREAIAPQMQPFGGMIHREVDRSGGEVRTSIAGVTSRAVYRGPEGCVVMARGASLPPPTPLPQAAAPPRLSPIAGQDVVVPEDGRLAAALDHAFAEKARAPYRRTKAIVILRDGHVIAERYAAGFGVETPIHGWSMTKSVTNALLGVLVHQGRLDMTAPAPIAAWADPKDPRHAITPDSLLRMTSGLDFGQSLTADWTLAFDPTAQMVYAQPDMAAFAAQAPAIARPGARFRYSNGNTLLLSQIIRDQAGGTREGVIAFMHRELFDKLGMEHPTLELDAAGTPIGSSHMWATARDWARLGQLYLDDGMAGGERILPAGWADYSARLTPDSERYGYGAGFWTNRGIAGFARDHRPDMPADSFFARGNQGEYIVIIPSRRLVIVRLGYAADPFGDIVGVNRLVAETVAATS